jgi:hypothetical protein
MKEKVMKQQQHIATLGLSAALSGVSPVIAADAGFALAHALRSSETVQASNTQAKILSQEQLDHVTAGFTDLPKTLYVACYQGSCTAYLSDGRYIAWDDELKGSWFRDSSLHTYGR